MKRLFKVTLLAVLAAMCALPSFAQREKTIKRKVAIGRFSNETKYGKGLFYDKENDPMRKQALDLLSLLPVRNSYFSKGKTLMCLLLRLVRE